MREGNIPERVMREVIKRQEIMRALAAAKGTPYCFICDMEFNSHDAARQHARAKHNGEGLILMTHLLEAKKT